MFKNKLKLVWSLIMGISMSLSPMVAIYGQSYPDIENHWAKDQMENWAEKEWIKAYPDGTLKPDSPLSRIDFIVLVNRAFGFESKMNKAFEDVAPSEWYYEEIQKALGAGYITYTSGSNFRPMDPMTRAEAAVMYGKILNLQPNESVAKSFTDIGHTPQWAVGYIGAVVEKGYMSGYPGGAFRGDAPVKRAEAIVTLDKILKEKELAASKEKEEKKENVDLPKEPEKNLSLNYDKKDSTSDKAQEDGIMMEGYPVVKKVTMNEVEVGLQVKQKAKVHIMLVRYSEIDTLTIKKEDVINGYISDSKGNKREIKDIIKKDIEINPSDGTAIIGIAGLEDLVSYRVFVVPEDKYKKTGDLYQLEVKTKGLYDK